MKKYILITLLATTVVVAKAQKLEKPSVDKITGAVTLTTKEEVVSNKLSLLGHKLAAYILKSNQEYVLSFHLVEGGGRPYLVAEGDSAYIKLSSGKVLTVKVLNSETAEWREGTNPPVYDCTVPYYLTADIVTQLLTDKIAFVRIKTSLVDYDFDVPDGKSEVIKKQLQLITKN